jgi:ribosomal protein S6--L-glutamate ligase
VQAVRAVLLLLTAHPELHAPRRLAAAAAELGLDFEFVAPDPWRVAAGAERGGVRVTRAARGGLLVARPGPFTLVAVLRTHRRLTRAGLRAAQTRAALLDACDQARTLRRLARAGLPVPATRLVRRPGEITTALAAIPGPPWIVKGRRGSQGSQVLLAASRDEAVRLVHLLWGTGAAPLVQQDLRATGRVERHLIAGGELLASAVALPAAGEFRTNAHRGGRFEALDPRSSRAAGLALRATAALALPFAAVDTIGSHAPVVLDVNASPGLEALEAATGRDLATPIVAALQPAASG